MILKAKTRLQMDTGKRGLLTEYKQRFSQLLGDPWEIPRNYKKILLREVTVAIKYGTWIRDR